MNVLDETDLKVIDKKQTEIDERLTACEHIKLGDRHALTTNGHKGTVPGTSVSEGRRLKISDSYLFDLDDLMIGNSEKYCITNIGIQYTCAGDPGVGKMAAYVTNADGRSYMKYDSNITDTWASIGFEGRKDVRKFTLEVEQQNLEKRLQSVTVYIQKKDGTGRFGKTIFFNEDDIRREEIKKLQERATVLESESKKIKEKIPEKNQTIQVFSCLCKTNSGSLRRFTTIPLWNADSYTVKLNRVKIPSGEVNGTEFNVTTSTAGIDVSINATSSNGDVYDKIQNEIGNALMLEFTIK